MTRSPSLIRVVVMRKLLLLSLLVTGCAMSPRYETPVAFTPYVQVFEAAYGKPVHSVEYGFADLGGDIVGSCSLYSDGHGKVQVDTKTWNAIDESTRAEIILHELGHCVLYRDHRVDLDADGNPLSIMYPYVLNDYYFASDEIPLLNELFTFKGGPMLKTGIVALPRTFECE